MTQVLGFGNRVCRIGHGFLKIKIESANPRHCRCLARRPRILQKISENSRRLADQNSFCEDFDKAMSNGKRRPFSSSVLGAFVYLLHALRNCKGSSAAFQLYCALPTGFASKTHLQDFQPAEDMETIQPPSRRNTAHHCSELEMQYYKDVQDNNFTIPTREPGCIDFRITGNEMATDQPE